MNPTQLIGPDDPVLVTGAAGFIGSRVALNLVSRGFTQVRCLLRPSSNPERLERALHGASQPVRPQMVFGNLLSREDCRQATREVKAIFHLAAGTGSKSFADAFLNSVVTTRNLVEAALESGQLRRFVNLSSFAVYTNHGNPGQDLLDERSPEERRPGARAEAYCYAKVKQDELVRDYGRRRQLPFVLLRPGVVYGPGKRAISGRVGIDTFGIFLHFGRDNPIPFTYVDNCAEAVVLAGLVPGVEGEVFNIVDDDLPTSRQFLKDYKRQVRSFASIDVPHWASYLFCRAWEGYARWSHNQLPPVFTRAEWHAYWKKTRYANTKLKQQLGWAPPVPTAVGMQRFFESCREGV